MELRMFLGILLLVVGIIMLCKWYYRYPKTERYISQYNDMESEAWKEDYGKYYHNMNRAKWIIMAAIVLILWSNLLLMLMALGLFWWVFKFEILKS